MNTNKTQTEQFTQEAVSRRLFRGFSKKHNNWIYGDLIYTPSGEFRILNFTYSLSDSITETYSINEIVETESVGQFTDQYSKTSVNQVVKQLAEKAGINKRVYTHLMRHNCFTHMAEKGTDINLIQKLAGHSNVKTTLLYTHLSDNLISKIQSPLGSISL